VSELVGPSAFHGIHGIAVAPNGKLLVGSVVGQAIYEIDPVTGANHELIGPPNGMADDIAFAPDGTMAWTAFLLGKVFAQKPGGPLVEVAKGLAGTNSLAFSADGHFYFSQVFAGDVLWEADVTGKAPMRKIAENLGGLNGFEVGKDGRIYGPLWFKGQVVAVDTASGKIEVVADGFKVPAAANFESKGNLWVIDTAEGALYRVDVKTHAKTKVAQLSPSLDNLAINAKDNIYVTNNPVDPADNSVSSQIINLAITILIYAITMLKVIGMDVCIIVITVITCIKTVAITVHPPWNPIAITIFTIGTFFRCSWIHPV
jgi:sugar lactone lactonase YvrE